VIFLFLMISCSSISTKNFTVIYPDELYKDCALQQLSILETYREDVIKFTHNDPGRTILFVDDLGGMINGGAMPSVNGIVLNSYIPAPVPRYGSFPSWWRIAPLHEYTHIANMTSTGGIPKLFRGLFGKSFQPNLYVPLWVAESYTVYYESRQFPFEGRLNEGFFDAYGNACARDNNFPGMYDFTYDFYEFPFGDSFYMWGGFMTRYRAAKYGEQRVSDWADRYGKSIPLLSFEYTHHSAYGKFSFDLYDEVKREFRKNLSEQKFSQKSEVLYSGQEYLDFLTHDGRYLYFKTGKIVKSSVYGGISYSEIVQLDPETGNSKTILKDPVLSAIPMRIKDGKIFYGKLDVFKTGGNLVGTKLKNDIYSLDINDSRKKKIYSDDGTLRTFDILKDGRLIIGRQKGWRGGVVEIIDKDNKDVIFSSDIDTPFDIVVGEDKTAILMHNEDRGNRIFFLEGDTVKIEEPYAKCGLNFVGEDLFFSSNRLGVWQAYMWKDSSLYKVTDLPFCTYPVILNNKIYFIGMSSEGQTIEIAEMTEWEKIEELQDLPDPALPSYSSLEYEEGGYINNFRHLLWDPVLRWPTFYEENNRMNFRLNVLGMDASGTRNLSWYLNYEEQDGLTGYGMKYSTFFLKPWLVRVEAEKDRDERSALLYLSYPLRISLGSGLQDVYLDFAASLHDSLDSRSVPLTFSPVFVFGDYNKTFFLSPSFIYESEELGSDIDRRGYQLYGGGSFSYPGFSILLSGVGIWDKSNPDSTLLEPICGEEKRMRLGGSLQLEIDYRIFKIGKGNNLIPVYFNGLYLRPFAQVIHSPDWDEPVTTVGGLITLETSALYILNLEPSIGVGYRVDEGKAYFLWGVTGNLGSTEIGIKSKLYPESPRAKNFFDFDISNFEFSIEKKFQMPWKL
jgi:hypothetical protein